MNRQRRAYTLLEVILTMAVIVIIVGLSFPLISSMYSQQRVRAGTDTVRAGWVKARTHAIEESRRYRFSVMLGKGNFRIAPDDPAFWSGSAPEIDDQHPAFVLEDALPEGIRFTVNNAPVDSQGDSVQQSGGSSDWTTLAIFEADGTAQDDAELTLNWEGGGARPMVVRLRAATGGSTVAYAEVGQ